MHSMPADEWRHTTTAGTIDVAALVTSRMRYYSNCWENCCSNGTHASKRNEITILPVNGQLAQAGNSIMTKYHESNMALTLLSLHVA